jgi:MFS transporter, DHA2 family, multidrug resistance protein
MLERRTQFHHSVLVQHLTPENPLFTQRLDNITRYLASAGSSTADAAGKAQAMIAGLANQQAAFLGSMDCFRLLGWIMLAGLILGLATKPFRSGTAPKEH